MRKLIFSLPCRRSAWARGRGKKVCYIQNSVLRGVQSDKTGLSDLTILCCSQGGNPAPFCSATGLCVPLALLWHSSNSLLNRLSMPIWRNISQDGFLSYQQLSWFTNGLDEHQIQCKKDSRAQPAPFWHQQTLRSV